MLNEAQPDAHALAEFCLRHGPLFVLTGAGCSTGSGIPAYRDREGNWIHAKPILFQDFVSDVSVRRRYWLRSLAGWPRLARARPGPAHTALAQLQQAGLVRILVTQNVDGLHQRAGSHDVLELHGNVATVSCLQCRYAFPRAGMQDMLLRANPWLTTQAVRTGPDGDAEPAAGDHAGIHVPGCPRCQSLLKPDAVFHGQSVPSGRVRRAMRALEQSRAVLVVGSSLTAYSAFRYCLAAHAAGRPLVMVNLGSTRADKLLRLKLDADCSQVLPTLACSLAAARRGSRGVVR